MEHLQSWLSKVRRYARLAVSDYGDDVISTPRSPSHRFGCHIDTIQVRLWSPRKVAFILGVAWVLLGLIAYRGQSWGKQNKPYTLAETFYVMAQIITTVGYGDYCPVRDSGFFFTALYVLMATAVISSVGAAVTASIIRSQGDILKKALSENRFAEDGIHLAERAFQEMHSHSQGSPMLRDVAATAHSAYSFLQDHPGISVCLKAFLVWSILVVAGIVFFCNYPGEQKTFAEAFYMSVMTLTTVGFGDKIPATEGGRVFATLWMFLGTAAFARMVAKFSAAYLVRGSLKRLEHCDLKDIEHDELFKKCHPDEGCSHISRADYILFVMKEIGSLDLDIVEQLSSDFDELDIHQSGTLNTDRVKHMTRVRRSFPAQFPPRFHTIG